MTDTNTPHGKDVPTREEVEGICERLCDIETVSIACQEAIEALRALSEERVSISDDDAQEIRRTLDDIDVWDGCDRAVDRLLSQFPNDPLNSKETP